MYVRVQRRRGARRAASDLRAAAPLRGAPARPRASARRSDITARICGICPVAYQMSACEAMEDALGVEVRPGSRDSAPPDLLRGVDGEPRPAPLHAPRARLPRLRERLRDGRRARRDRRARPADEEGRQRADRGDRRPRGPPDQRPRRRLLPGPRAPRAGAAAREARAGARGGARDRALDGRAALPGAASTTTSSSRCGRRRQASTRSTEAGSSPRAGSTSRRRSSTRSSRSSTSSTRTRCTPGSAGAAPTWRGRWRASTSTATGSRRWPPRRPRRRGSARACRNPFQSIVVRAVEILYAFDEALRMIDAYEPPDSPAVAGRATRRGRARASPRRRAGCSTTATRSTRTGGSSAARIVPPTSQNQRSIEEDLERLVAANAGLDDEELQLRCEQAIRNYDPCISCATHFLRLEVDRDVSLFDRDRQPDARRRRRRAAGRAPGCASSPCPA